jgi:hypothetical protein
MALSSENRLGILGSRWWSNDHKADLYGEASDIFTAPQLLRYAGNIGVLVRYKRLQRSEGELQVGVFQKLASSVGASPSRIDQLYRSHLKGTQWDPGRAS